MASYNPPSYGVEYIFYITLSKQSDPRLVQVNPTLATGDVKIEKDGAGAANLNTLPAATPASGPTLKVTVSATEMTADNVVIRFSDAAGAEWCDLTINMQPEAQAWVQGSVNDAGAAAGDFDGDASLSATNDFYNGDLLVFTMGTHKGIARTISDYVGASKNLQFNGAAGATDAPFTSAPANGDRFIIIGRAVA